MDTGALLNPRYGHSATLLPDGKVLVLGGRNSEGVIASAEIYDPASGTWTAQGNLLLARMSHTATLLANGKVLVYGGFTGTPSYGPELYDPATGASAFTTNYNTDDSRLRHSATLLSDGKLMVIGGWLPSEPYYWAQMSIEIWRRYDPVSGHWEMTPSSYLNTRRDGHASVQLADGRVLAIGGFRDSNNASDATLSSVESWDPSTWQWSSSTPMIHARRGHVAYTMGDGRVVVVGGDESNSSAAEVLDPASSTWTASGPMQAFRTEGYSTTRLASGKATIIGGVLNGTSTSGAEMFNPDTNAWRRSGSLITPRAHHTATLLPDGRILVAGGADGAWPVLTAELYTPDSYSLVLSPTENGSINNSSAGGTTSHEIGGTAQLTATPSPGYLFTGWTGEASGTVNPLSLAMDDDKTVGATFDKDLADSDGDGFTNYQELAVYHTNPNSTDTDGDGLSDGFELGAGRFSIVKGSFTWAQAKADAETRGGTLATFATEDEWTRAFQALGPAAFDPHTGLWIGASDQETEGTWQWITDEPFTFANWAAGEPNDSSNSDFAEVRGGEGADLGKWYDRPASQIRDAYILEAGFSTDPTDADSDNDGLGDGDEHAAGTNPFMVDTDNDTLTDAEEIQLSETNPLLADSNNDGLGDASEDPDGDGLSHLDEIRLHHTDPLLADTDDDGLNDGVEVNYDGRYFTMIPGAFTYDQAAADAVSRRGRLATLAEPEDRDRVVTQARKGVAGSLWIGLGDSLAEGVWVWSDGSVLIAPAWLLGQPNGGLVENHVVIAEGSNQWADAVASHVAAGYLFERVGLDPLAADTDGDGMSDAREVNEVGSSPVLADTDGDGLSDKVEVDTHGSDPKKEDSDQDGLSDFAEVTVHHSSPILKDTDGDGFDDAFEVNTGYNPASAASTPDAASSIRTAVEFRFNAAAGVSYRIEASTDLQQWSTIETDVTGEGGVVSRFYPAANQATRYFRAKRN